MQFELESKDDTESSPTDPVSPGSSCTNVIAGTVLVDVICD